MKLSERLEAEIGYWPRTSTLSAVLREAVELARSVENAEVAHVEPKNGLAVMRALIDVRRPIRRGNLKARLAVHRAKSACVETTNLEGEAGTFHAHAGVGHYEGI